MAMDPVNKKALKKDFDDRADKDIDNDGDTDSTDKYLHKRRQAVSKAIGKMKESVAVFESHFQVGQKVEYEAPDGGEYYGKIIKTDKPEEGAYYHVKLENGKVVKAKPEQLEAEDDDEDEDEDKEMDEAWKKDSGWKKPTVHKDKYGNVIKTKNVAKSLAKSAAKKSAGVKEEVELDEGLYHVEYGISGKLAHQVIAKDANEAHKKAMAHLKKKNPKLAHPDYSDVFKKKSIVHIKGNEPRADRYKTESVDLDEKVYASDYNVGHEKSQFGGYRPHVTNKKTGKTMYLGQTSYKSPEHAKGHASAYLKGYEQMGDRTANRMANEYEKANKKHVYKEEVEQVDEISRVDYKKHGKTFANLRKLAQAKVDKEIASKTKSTKKEEVELEEKLSVSDGMGTWIDDFKKSDAPQFKGKDDKERREMAIAAYLAAKRKNK